MLAIAEPRAKPKAERFYRPLRLRDGRVFLFHFPSTSYWATFTVRPGQVLTVHS
jgi:hypothetical protein